MTAQEPPPTLQAPKQLSRMMRRCLATGESVPKQHLMRFVIDPNGLLTPDLKQTLPGRGLWITPEKNALEKAIKKNLFAKAARQKVQLPNNLLEGICQQIHKHLLDRLGLIRRAGDLVAGFEKTVAAFKEQSICLYLQADDGAQQSKQKIKPYLSQAQVPFYDSLFSADELGYALGRGPSVHVAIMRPSQAQALEKDLKILLALLPQAPLLDDQRAFAQGGESIQA